MVSKFMCLREKGGSIQGRERKAQAVLICFAFYLDRNLCCSPFFTYHSISGKKFLFSLEMK